MPSRLSAKPIVNFQGINSYKTANQWSIYAGNNNTLYFQVVDLDQCGLRYIPGIGVTNQPVGIKVIFPSIDCSKKLELIAQQQASDGSIWSVQIPVTNTPQTGNVMFQLFEGNNYSSFVVDQMLIVNFLNNGGDGSTPDNSFFF